MDPTTMSKNQPKEHYVQQRYLKYFSTNLVDHIHVYDKISRSFRDNQPIDRIACEGKFYDIDFETLINELNGEQKKDDILSLQSFMGNTFTDEFLTKEVEPIFDAIDNLIVKINQYGADFKRSIDWVSEGEIRQQISLYMAYQYLRTAAFRDNFLSFLNNGHVELQNLNTQKEVGKLAHLRILLDQPLVSSIAQVIYFGVWNLGKAFNGQVFFTSDNPIHLIVDASKPQKIFSNILLLSYPLSPEIMLMVWSPSIANRLGYKDYLNQIVQVREDRIDWFNSQRVMGAKRFVCCSTNQLKTAERMMSEFDKLSPEEYRKRFYKI
jgi:hypothetical protein